MKLLVFLSQKNTSFFLLIHYKCIRIFAVVISCARMKPVPHSSLNTLPSLSFFFLLPDVSLQLPWLTANSFITGHKRQVLHLKGRHPPSPPAWVKNRPAGIAHRTRCSISTKWRPAGPKRWARSLSSRGTDAEAEGTLLQCFSSCYFIQRNFGRTQAEEVTLRLRGNKLTLSHCNLTSCINPTRTRPLVYSATPITKSLFCVKCVFCRPYPISLTSRSVITL